MEQPDSSLLMSANMTDRTRTHAYIRTYKGCVRMWAWSQAPPMPTFILPWDSLILCTKFKLPLVFYITFWSKDCMCLQLLHGWANRENSSDRHVPLSVGSFEAENTRTATRIERCYILIRRPPTMVYSFVSFAACLVLGMALAEECFPPGSEFDRPECECDFGEIICDSLTTFPVLSTIHGDVVKMWVGRMSWHDVYTHTHCFEPITTAQCVSFLCLSQLAVVYHFTANLQRCTNGVKRLCTYCSDGMAYYRNRKLLTNKNILCLCSYILMML